MSFVTPETYFIGATALNHQEFERYLRDSGNEDFLETVEVARQKGLSQADILCSFYAKLCYKSLTLGQNANVTRIRDIESNLNSIVETGHGSVFEHVQLNFVVRNCSRVFTHELVRHRVGTAFSQTSGRYVALENIDFVLDPILAPVEHIVKNTLTTIEIAAQKMRETLITEGMDFATKKKITSAIRRIAPNGGSNEVGFSLNIRSLRHIIQMRTSRHAEWEIRHIFNQVAKLIEERYPQMLYGGKKELVDGYYEYTNLRI